MILPGDVIGLITQSCAELRSDETCTYIDLGYSSPANSKPKSTHNFTRLMKWCFGRGSSSSTMDPVTLSTARIAPSVGTFVRRDLTSKLASFFIFIYRTLQTSDEVRRVLQVRITDDSHGGGEGFRQTLGQTMGSAANARSDRSHRHTWLVYLRETSHGRVAGGLLQQVKQAFPLSRPQEYVPRLLLKPGSFHLPLAFRHFPVNRSIGK
ncbi:uncharacterized protein [Penaeus vannamei]|uniref:uncharacterized protein n=1 Tax=Penaeus vannamei TaxID=6689 RepID=UPI00387F7C4F